MDWRVVFVVLGLVLLIMFSDAPPNWQPGMSHGEAHTYGVLR